MSTQSGAEGIELLDYQGEEILDHDAQKIFMVSAMSGLTGGGYVIHPKGDCNTLLRDLRKLLRQKYPNLRTTKAVATDACYLNTMITQKDPTSGSVVALSIEPNMNAIQLTYMAPDALDAETKKARQRYDSSKREAIGKL